jgi:hypothetical protein
MTTDDIVKIFRNTEKQRSFITRNMDRIFGRKPSPSGISSREEGPNID